MSKIILNFLLKYGKSIFAILSKLSFFKSLFQSSTALGLDTGASSSSTVDASITNTSCAIIVRPSVRCACADKQELTLNAVSVVFKNKVALISKKDLSLASSIPSSFNILNLSINPRNNPKNKLGVRYYSDSNKSKNLINIDKNIVITQSRGKFDSLLFTKYFDNLLLDATALTQIFNEFWSHVVEKLDKNKYLILLVRLKYVHVDRNPGGLPKVIEFFSTLDVVHRITVEDKSDTIRAYVDILNSKAEWYRSSQVKEVTIEYWEKENLSGMPLHMLSTIKNLKKNSEPGLNLSRFSVKLNSINAPLNRDYESWGNVIENRVFDKGKSFLSVQDFNNKDKYYHIEINPYNSKISIFSQNKVIMTFIDYDSSEFLPVNLRLLPKNKTVFIRTINNFEFYIRNNEIVFKTIKYKTDFLLPIQKEKNIINKFITLDIETRVENNVHIPYSICYYDGKKKFPFFVTDFNNHHDMLENVILSLLRPKYTGYNIYVHNLSSFDGIFLFNTFANIINKKKKIEILPVLRGGNFINIKIKYDKYFISFKDSMLILPNSLRNLAIQFKVDHPKSYFPHDFLNNSLNNDVDLNYIGKIPGMDYFSDIQDFISFREENEDKLYNWNLREESLKYCLTDCICLYEVLVNFNKFIFEKFKINIHSYPTLPSLTFAIFRSNYLKKVIKSGYNIPLINGKMYEDIKNSYTGGSTDMYKPSNLEGTYIFENDVNSLYPRNMAKGMLMPVVSNKNKYVIFFQGDVREFRNSPFGFFNTDIKTHGYMDHPILQLRYDTSNLGGSGIRTISPLGEWNSMYFSEEIYNAENYFNYISSLYSKPGAKPISELKNFNYYAKIKSGYLFDQFDVFSGFIEDLYKIKQAHTKYEPWYAISKSLLNSLYGKFAMNPIMETHAIIESEELDYYLDKFEVADTKNLNNSKLLISYKNKQFMENNTINKKKNNNNANVSISISSAITAYARIFMAKHKNSPFYDLYYTDTDSLFTDKPLGEEFMGAGLGQFKLEKIYSKIYFVAPKVYGGITNEGVEVTKVKGLKNPVSVNDLKELLIKNNSVVINQAKWFKSIEKGNITIKDQLYTLTATENKRELVYENGIMVGTKPFVIKELNQDESKVEKE